jgi:hypothetical protein
MALRAKLAPPELPTPSSLDDWPWHKVEARAVPASIAFRGDRRVEAGMYLASGFGIRSIIEARRGGWCRFDKFANVWAPPRIKQILVDRAHGTPYLNTSQVFDLRATPRKWLSMEKTTAAERRLATQGTILVLGSATPGRATITTLAHENAVISHHFLRVDPLERRWRGWIYAFLKSAPGFAMMSGSQYASVIRHIEPRHLGAIPVPKVDDETAARFADSVDRIIRLRNDAHRLALESEAMFAGAIGSPRATTPEEEGFTVSSAAVFKQRRRLEGSYYNPKAKAILALFRKKKLDTERLDQVTDRVWWMTRFKRVFGNEGVPYLSAEELFALNPPVTKRVLVEQADNADDFYVKRGWIVMACSGQVYGLNGSVALMTKRHESSFLSHDLIRIVPNAAKIRAGYLYTALGHPTLGRPLVIRNGYGTSIPHLDPDDVSAVPVVRLGKDAEDAIADLAEASARARGEADILENGITDEATAIVSGFLAGPINAALGPVVSLTELTMLYKIRNPLDVEEMLAEIPDLGGLLIEAHGKILSAFGADTALTLEVVEETNVFCTPSELVLRVTSSLSPSKAKEILNQLDNEWWLDALPRGQHRVTISMNLGGA